ncbi:hypothetical protein [Kitasatospora sp. NPDC094011]|uniref:hypothetical protein n=1 Tax=Kitasatospora sp. NPDC094011 TaxID=3364090 RepID=UPI0038121B21
MAHADTARGSDNRAAVSGATLTNHEAVRQVAANLLQFEGSRFTADERAEIQAIADGSAAQDRGKFDALVKLLKKVKGFAGAVAKSYDAFKGWYDGLPWYVKGPLSAAGVGSNLYDIWQLFH